MEALKELEKNYGLKNTMMCPICNSPTRVKDTRRRIDNYVIRKRICYNDHIFQTEEKAGKLLRPVQKGRPKAAGTNVPSSAKGKT